MSNRSRRGSVLGLLMKSLRGVGSRRLPAQLTFSIYVYQNSQKCSILMIEAPGLGLGLIHYISDLP